MDKYNFKKIIFDRKIRYLYKSTKLLFDKLLGFRKKVIMVDSIYCVLITNYRLLTIKQCRIPLSQIYIRAKFYDSK